MAKFNKDTCIAILKAMLLDDRPVIHYIVQEDPAPKGQLKHTYRFFVINNCGHYNVSGLVTAAFGVNVQDRSSAFSINQLNAEEDIKGFRTHLAQLLGEPKLRLEDLILSAKDTLEFGISPYAAEFLPMAPMPAAIRESDNKAEPISLPS